MLFIKTGIAIKKLLYAMIQMPFFINRNPDKDMGYGQLQHSDANKLTYTWF